LKFIGHIFEQMDKDIETRGMFVAQARVVPAILSLLAPEDESRVRLGCPLSLIATEVTGDGVVDPAIFDLYFVIDGREIYLGRASTRWAMLDEVAAALKLSSDSSSPISAYEPWEKWTRK
jgi:hypothetical protein